VTKTYKDFVQDLGARESQGDYTCVNTLGYLGKYQFGLARLSDFNLCTRKAGTKGYGNSSFTWRPPYSEAWFLASPEVQDYTFNLHVGHYKRVIESRYMMTLGKTYLGTLVTLSGAVACCHLLGVGGFQMFARGIDSTDEFGTSAKDYIAKFAGYKISEDLPSLEDFRKFLATRSPKPVALVS